MLSYKLSYPEDTLHKRLFYFLLSSHYDSDYFLFSSNLLLYFLFPTHFALSSITLKNHGRHFRAKSTPRNFELCEVAEHKLILKPEFTSYKECGGMIGKPMIKTSQPRTPNRNGTEDPASLSNPNHRFWAAPHSGHHRSY